MGPFFAISSLLHVPMWVAQRLWLGTILRAAGWGILFLCRTMRLRGPGPIVREASGVHAKPLPNLPSPSGVHRQIQAGQA